MNRERGGGGSLLRCNGVGTPEGGGGGLLFAGHVERGAWVGGDSEWQHCSTQLLCC